MIKDRLNDQWARIIVTPIIALVISFTGVDLQLTGVGIISLNFLISLVYVIIYWELNRLFFVYITKKLPENKNTKRRLAAELCFIAGFILLAGIILDVANYALPGMVGRISFLMNYTKNVEKSLFSLGIITILFEVIYFFSLYENSRFENQRLKEEALISQLILLRQQISPHFLFNNLNALITLIPKNPELSVQYIQKLSTVYRQVLDVNEKDLVSLESELKFLEDYVFLYQIRFGDKLQVSYNISQDIKNFKVLPMALQMLVENAIKHNIISSENKLFIVVNVNSEVLTVSNNLQKKTSGVVSSNTGLANIKSRYRLLTDKAVTIEATQDLFSVSIPILT